MNRRMLLAAFGAAPLMGLGAARGRGRNWLVPNAWDPSWTQRRKTEVLNQQPTAWTDLVPQEPPVPLSAPFGAGNSGWQNPTVTHTVPITSNSGGNIALLTSNLARNLLIIQNNSTATFPDTTPVFYIGFGQVAQVGQGLGLAAGLGLVLDIICPRNAVYLTIGPFVDGGATTVVQGAIVEGGLSAS